MASTRTAAAEDPGPPAPQFGERGEWVLTDASSINTGFTAWQNSPASSFGVTFAPGADLFVARNLSVGLALDAEYQSYKGYAFDGSLIASHATTLGIGARVGWNIPISGAFSFYPRFTLGLGWIHVEQPGATPFDAWWTLGPTVDLYLPLLLHPVPHLFLGFGPWLDQGFWLQGGQLGRRGDAGLELVVGGWWGGPPGVAVAREEHVPPTPGALEARERRYGDEGQVVLTSGFGLSLSSATPNSGSLVIEPGVDVFFMDHVSIGGSLILLGPAINGLAPGVQQFASPNNYGGVGMVAIAPRMTWDIPLGRTLSINPRLSVPLGVQDFNVGSANEYDTDFARLVLYVPVLVHPVQHFFAGFGPSLAGDLVRQVQLPTGVSQGSSTVDAGRSITFGGSFLLGGWL